MGATLLVGQIRTLDPACPTAEAVAFDAGRIVAVGPRAELEARVSGAEVIDVGEATVLPGFIDAHHHVAISALYDGALRLVPPKVTDIASLQAALAEAREGSSADRWLVGTHWDETLLRERRPPTRQELDAAVPDRPLFLLHHTCHRALGNSKALELAGVDRHTPEPSGGVISRGPGGVPDGLLVERGMAPVEQLARADRLGVDEHGVLVRMAAHYRAVARAGITRLCDTAVPRDLLGTFRALAARGDVLVPTHACPVSIRGWLPEPVDALEGEPTGEEAGPNLWIGAVKLVFDGAPGCSMCLTWGQSLVALARTLALTARQRSLDPLRTALSIAPRWGLDVRSGIALYQPQEGERIVRLAVERGFAVASHALGNAAIEVALRAYAAAGRRLHDGGVARLEHAAFSDAGDARRMADLGVAAVVQPAMLEMHMAASAARIPGLPFFPLRRLRDAGVRLAGSSDYPVHTFDPLAGIRAAIARKNARGDVVDPEQRISLDEALAMYTRDAAEVLNVGHETGTLTPGKRADLVVVEGLTDGEPRVVRTFVGGLAP
ncbi:MAG: amidohydrolase [Polyangiaceae bacterium]|jgi:predicted amidohydrolase YtcJ|nr:amidohydrolase [Polyangiaceae bacterium]